MIIHSPRLIPDFTTLVGKQVFYATTADVEMLGGRPHTFPKLGVVYSATRDSVAVGGSDFARDDLIEVYPA